jgi:hypothetical protein
VEYYGVSISLRVHPHSVEIYACQRAPRIAIDNSISIDHRNTFDKIVVSQEFGANRWSDKIVEDAFHHVGGSCFAWMYTSTDDDSLLLFDLFRGIIEISNRQHIARISRESLTKQLSLKVTVGARISFNPG